MRSSLRALFTSADRPSRTFTLRLTALVVAIVTAAVTALAVIGVSTTAQAQPPVVTIDPFVNAAPLTGAEKAARMLAVDRQVGRALVAEQARIKVVKAQQVRARVVQLAKAQIGDSYVAGAAGPSRFDCSGLTRYVFQKAAGKSLPHQSHAQYAQVKKIRFADAEPGDLVFFFRGGAHHVGVYIGNKKMVDAAGYGEGVRISPITGSWWSRTYSGMGRILPA
ncbi:MAG: C40 family peptidase [Actinobacteria bacterium]|nr:C40 family peptidase [Actinomycetota bacterium]